jgi:anti-sigma regulatory factor (Ser/Thr protein kinase)
MRVLALTLPHAPASASRARRALVEHLRSSGVPTELVGEAELALSEMVGNAVKHARPRADGSLLAKCEVAEGAICLTVIDGGGSSVPTMRRASPEEGSGRGLAIVAALAESWGVDRYGADTRVWAEFAW